MPNEFDIAPARRCLVHAYVECRVRGGAWWLYAHPILPRHEYLPPLLVGAGVTLVAALANGVSTTPWTSSEGVSSFLNFLGNELLGVVGVSFLGMLIAVLTRSAAVAVSISLAYALVAEPLIEMLWPDGAQWLPIHIFGYLPGVSSPMSYGPAPMGYGSDLVVALLYMVGCIVVGFAAFRVMDITA